MCTSSALCLYVCVFKTKVLSGKIAWTLNATLPLPNWFLWTSEQEAHHWLANSVLLSLRYLGPCRFDVCLEKLGTVIFISVAECMAAKQWVEYANGTERLTEKKELLPPFITSTPAACRSPFLPLGPGVNSNQRWQCFIYRLWSRQTPSLVWIHQTAQVLRSQRGSITDTRSPGSNYSISGV